MPPSLQILSYRLLAGKRGWQMRQVSGLCSALQPAVAALPACLPARLSCLYCSCCPLLSGNGIACVQPEGVTVADLLREDKKKRKFCCFRQRRAKDHGNLLRCSCSVEASCVTFWFPLLAHRHCVSCMRCVVRLENAYVLNAWFL